MSETSWSEVNEPVCEPLGDGLVWDPINGVTRLKEAGEVEVRLYGDRGEKLYRPQIWRDPGKARPDDKRDRLVVVATGVKLVARLNHWRKWVAYGVGVVDPVGYMDIADLPRDFPWYEGMR